MISEPLIGKELKLPEGLKISPEGFGFFAKKDVESAVEFYKRYHNDAYSSEGYELLKEEKPEIYKEFVDYMLINRICGCVYNYWLYEYCFKDAIE